MWSGFRECIGEQMQSAPERSRKCLGVCYAAIVQATEFQVRAANIEACN